MNFSIFLYTHLKKFEIPFIDFLSHTFIYEFFETNFHPSTLTVSLTTSVTHLTKLHKFSNFRKLNRAAENNSRRSQKRAPP